MCCIEPLYKEPQYVSTFVPWYLQFTHIMYNFFSAGHPQPTHIIYPADPTAMTYRPLPASQLALASTRYGTVPGTGYHLTTSSSGSPLQPLSHFSQSGHFQYIAATNPSHQNTTFTHTSATFQPRPVQGLAYGLQPGSIQVATPVQTAYIARPPRPMQQQQQPPVGYGLPRTSVPAYNSQMQTPERLPNPPTYSPEDYSSSAQQQQQSRQQWSFP